MIPFINIHTHQAGKGQLAILNAPNTGLWPDSDYYSYGIHPWDIGIIETEVEIENLKKYCDEKRLIAIGEIGIDRAIETSVELQNNIFIKQLEVANKYGLPVILHCVKAWSDILSEKKNKKHHTPWILHGFYGNLQTAEQLIKAGCYLSFGSKLLVNQKVQEIFERLPVSNIFFETDDSTLKIEDIYQKAAELFDICTPDLQVIINNNFNKVFGERCTKNG